MGADSPRPSSLGLLLVEMTYDLIDDYTAAISALPEAQQEKQKQLQIGIVSEQACKKLSTSIV